jgi:hypothetical protein
LQLASTGATDPGTGVEDALNYYVSKGDANIRSNSNPASVTSAKIPIGTKMKRVRTFNGGAVAQMEVLQAAPGSTTAVGTKYWTTFTNVQASTVVNEPGFFVSFSDTWVYGSPYTKPLTTGTGTTATKQALAASTDTSYTVVERCGDYAKVQQGGVDKGWVRKGALMNQTTRDRAKYMTDFKAWLDARYTEVSALQGDAKKDRIKGILSVVESVCHDIETGTFPVIADLNKTPVFEDHTYTSFTPPELTASVRRFIVALEAGAAGATDTIDWNARLGVPQYRTQSDNLAPPEATCGPTSFAMGAERLGYSRADVITAIDTKLKASLAATATQADVEKEFETKAKSFLEKFKSDSESYQKIRGGNESLAGKEGDLAKTFRTWGQYEDLSYFLAWLNGIERGAVASPSSQTMLDSLHDAHTGVDNAAGDNSELISFGSSDKLTYDHRKKIQDTLAAGGAVILSLYHKGTGSGTHILTVREVLPEGLGTDDPYGKINPEYRAGVAGDAFKDKGGASGRSSYNWKNVPDYSSTSTDYAERDFTESASEELETNESRGQNEILTWAMLEESTRLINYLRFYTRR